MPYSRYIIDELPWYSVLVVTGMLIAYLLAEHEEKRIGLPKDTAIDLALLIIPVGIIGARLYYVLFSLDSFIKDPLSVFYVWHGGLAIYGGLIAGAIAIVVFAQKRRIPPLRLLDMLAPGVALAQAIGRWGNFFNMEAYGTIVSDPHLQFFPFAVRIIENGAETWHLATFFYESCWSLLSFVLLWTHRTRKQYDGDVVFAYIMLYGLGRQMIEPLRTDSLMLANIRISQFVAMIAVCSMLMLFAIRLYHTNRKPLFIAIAVVALLCGIMTLLPTIHPLTRLLWAVVCCGIWLVMVDKNKKRL